MKRLHEDTVRSIRTMHQEGRRQADIARAHGISPASVCRIVRGSRHAVKETQANASQEIR